MGQILGLDQIAVPTSSTGVVTLPPSLLTLGGRQFRTPQLQRTIATDVPSMTLGTPYFVYALLVGGVPVLRVSATVPSAYKLANPTAKLVTAFYPVDTASVGAWLTIEGPPRTYGGYAGTDFLYQPGLLSLAAGPGATFTWGNGTNSTMISRDGAIADIKARFIFGSTTGWSVSGGLKIVEPSWLTRYQLLSADGHGSYAEGYCQDVSLNSVYGGLGMYDWGPNGLMLQLYKEAGASVFLGQSVPFAWAINDELAVHYRTSISGWSSTPLKDL